MRRIVTLDLGTSNLVQRVLVIWLVAAGVGFRATPAAATRLGGESMTAEAFVRMVADSAGPVSLADRSIRGDVDLRAVQTVRVPLRCHHCHFEGSFTGTGVVFEDAVDMRRSVFEGPLRLDAAVLREHGAFDGVELKDLAEVSRARFTEGVSFANAVFHRTVHFDDARTVRSATFNGATFVGEAGFSGTDFEGKASFAGANFNSSAVFTRASFGGHANFLLVTFGLYDPTRPTRDTYDVDFVEADLAAGGTFQFAHFNRRSRFDRMSGGDMLSFDGATVVVEATFHNVTSNGSVSIVDLRFHVGAHLYISDISVNDLSMDLSTLDEIPVPDERKEILSSLETSSKKRGDLTLANKARYRLLSLLGREQRGVARAADEIYRLAFGYLIRPLNPLLTLLGLVVATGVVRGFVDARARDRAATLSRRQEPITDSHDPERDAVLANVMRPPPGPGVEGVKALVSGMRRSVRAAVALKPDIKLDEVDSTRELVRSLALGAEFWTYKILLAVTVLAFGNANPPIHRILESIR